MFVVPIVNDIKDVRGLSSIIPTLNINTCSFRSMCELHSLSRFSWLLGNWGRRLLLQVRYTQKFKAVIAVKVNYELLY